MERVPMLKSTLGLLLIAGASMPLASWAVSDRIETAWSYSDGAAYDNLRHIQADKSGHLLGPQGPIRTESMGPMWRNSDAAAYDNLGRIQAFKSDSSQSAQGPIRSDRMGTMWSYSEGAAFDNLRTPHAGY